MKKALLLILMFVLPWQTIAAAERHLTHVMSSSGAGGFEYVGKHLAEHESHVLHHHEDDGGNDDDGATHVDKSDKSLQHLNDYEHGCGPNLPPPGAPLALALVLAPRLAPIPRLASYSDRSTLPPLPPPRARA
jgi:hypothetical protein